MALPKKNKPLSYDIISGDITPDESNIVFETNRFILAIKQDELERVTGKGQYDYPDFIEKALALVEALYEMDEEKIRRISEETLILIDAHYSHAESTKKILEHLSEIQV